MCIVISLLEYRRFDVIFFFKEKTAYELRISDWSSDVCSSDLNLSKAFKGVQALDGVSLQVHEGEILGLLGPNGSGKSTFINVVSGHFPATGGQMFFEGRQLAGLEAHTIAQAGIARTYQIPRPFAHLKTGRAHV